MAYIPKHKINKSIAGKDEFIYKTGRNSYIGPYIETADGKYYAGEDPYKLIEGNLLEKSTPSDTDFTFEGDRNTRIYNIINKKLKKNLEKVKLIPTNKPKPTEKDYEKFKFSRYFAIRINSQYGYFEIDKKTYKSIKSEKAEYDFNLYTVGEIEWALVGDTHIININTLKTAEIDYPGLSLCFKNLKEYKSDKNLNIFNKLNNYDPYNNKGLTTAQLKAAIDYTNSQKEIKSPDKLIDPDNFKLYNIEGRQYTDGVSIPNNLPKAYGLPKPIEKVLVENQNCHTCYFNNGGLCNYWNASIRHNYWCAAWVNYNEDELTYAEYQDQITETVSTKTSTVSSIGDNTLNDKSPLTSTPSTGGSTSGGGGGGY